MANYLTPDPSEDVCPPDDGSGLKSRRLLAEAIRHRDTEPVKLWLTIAQSFMGQS